jgi:hypothetical protein
VGAELGLLEGGALGVRLVAEIDGGADLAHLRGARGRGRGFAAEGEAARRCRKGSLGRKSRKEMQEGGAGRRCRKEVQEGVARRRCSKEVRTLPPSSVYMGTGPSWSVPARASDSRKGSSRSAWERRRAVAEVRAMRALATMAWVDSSTMSRLRWRASVKYWRMRGQLHRME